MTKEVASRVWVELNNGEKPPELKDVPLDTHEQVWAEMQKVAKLASKAEVNRIWAEKCGLPDANVMFPFGHP